jgi:hypothetical protein
MVADAVQVGRTWGLLWKGLLGMSQGIDVAVECRSGSVAMEVCLSMIKKDAAVEDCRSGKNFCR